MAMDMWKGDDLEARMVTRKFLKSGASCILDFYYWMAFSSGGRLAVEVMEDGKQTVVGSSNRLKLYNLNIFDKAN